MKTALLLLLAISAALPGMADETKPAAAPAPVPAQVVKDVTPEEAAKLIREDSKIVVLDVRTPEEYSKGHIAGAKNVDFLGDNFSKGTAALDPKTPVIVHCAAGGRSTQALDQLKDKQVIYHLKGGFKAWEKAGQPVEK